MDSEEDEFTYVEFGSYKITAEGDKISIECRDWVEVVLFLNRVEAQQFITKMYTEINKLS